ARIPGAARRPTTQRMDGQDNLVAGLKRPTGPPIPGHQTRRATFQIPDRRAAVRPFDLQQKVRVRIGVFELLHGADEFDRVLLVEHGKRMMRDGSAAARNERTRCNESGQLPSHSILPVDVIEPAIMGSRVAAQALRTSVGCEYDWTGK